MSDQEKEARRWAVVVLAAGYGSRLHKDIIADDSGQFIHLLGQPKALLPVGGKPLLDHWIHRFKETDGLVDLSRVYIVTNALMYPKFVKWANGVDGFATENVINDETKTYEGRLGAVGDLKLVIEKKRKEIDGFDILVVAGDTLFLSDFELTSFLERLPEKKCGCVYYKLSDPSEVSKRGIVEVEESSGLVIKLLEKPLHNQTTSRFACPAFYALRSRVVLKHIRSFGSQIGASSDYNGEEDDKEHKSKAPPGTNPHADSIGGMMGWLVKEKKIQLRGAPLIGRFDIADLAQWKETLTHFSMVLDEHLNKLPPKVVSRVCARIGVMGNPSDGFGGKTLSLSIRNFHAEVTLRPSRRLVLVAHPEFDPSSFSSLEHLAGHTDQNGYYGGLRLLKATCRMFKQLCKDAGVEVSGNFTMSYSTTIPRMVGLAGSSAIITAAFKGLMRFYGLTLLDLKLKKEALPQKILDIEVNELGINAGLQDRVIQVYGGLVHMNFDSKLIKTQGHGDYTPIDPKLLPTMYLAWNTTVAEESGKVHSTAKQRWIKGEKLIVDGMKEVASFADEAKKALVADNTPEDLAGLMQKNFALRRKMYGDGVVGERNIELVSLAKNFGMAAKFSGSGGAVVCLRIVNNKNKSSNAEGEKDQEKNKNNEENNKDEADDPFAFTEEEENKIRLSFISKGYEFARIHPNLSANQPEVGSNIKRSTSYFSGGGDAATVAAAAAIKNTKSCRSPAAKSGIVLQID